MREGSATVVNQLVELVTNLERDNSDTAAGLHELIDNGVDHVTGCQYAGITVAEKSNTVSSVAATHCYPMVLDAIQNRCGEGPCLAAAWEHHVMHIVDLRAAHPAFKTVQHPAGRHRGRTHRQRACV